MGCEVRNTHLITPLRTKLAFVEMTVAIKSTKNLGSKKTKLLNPNTILASHIFQIMKT